MSVSMEVVNVNCMCTMVSGIKEAIHRGGSGKFIDNTIAETRGKSTGFG